MAQGVSQYLVMTLVGYNLNHIGRTDAEAEAPTLWPPDEESTHGKSL